MLLFELSMPNNASWNGRWSGEENYYAILRSESRAGKAESDKSHYYDFGDGWGASVKVTRVLSGSAPKIRRRSKGFCGYDWMVDEIVKHGRILTLAERDKL